MSENAQLLPKSSVNNIVPVVYVYKLLAYCSIHSLAWNQSVLTEPYHIYEQFLTQSVILVPNFNFILYILIIISICIFLALSDF